MADLTITATSVVQGSNAQVVHGSAAVAITAGQAVYESASGEYSLADNDSGTAAVREVAGIALNGAAAGQPLSVQKSGDITIGATLTKGGVYCLSSTAGGICPVADLASGDDVILIGIAKSTTVLAVKVLDYAITL